MDQTFRQSQASCLGQIKMHKYINNKWKATATLTNDHWTASCADLKAFFSLLLLFLSIPHPCFFPLVFFQFLHWYFFLCLPPVLSFPLSHDLLLFHFSPSIISLGRHECNHPNTLYLCVTLFVHTCLDPKPGACWHYGNWSWLDAGQH